MLLMGHGKGLQSPVEGPSLVSCFLSPPGCSHHGLPGQRQGWHVPILLPVHPLVFNPALKWPGSQHREASLSCGSDLMYNMR